jgi:lanthanide-dependent methanol dehydrogenase
MCLRFLSGGGCGFPGTPTSGRPVRRPAFLGVLALLAACGKPAGSDLLTLQRDDAQWVMAAKNYASTRFSGLDQINTTTVRNLKVVWTVSTGNVRGHEAAPLVIRDTMYFVTPFPNQLLAIDLRQPGTLKWKYRPRAQETEAQGVACCDVVNRGAAYADGRIFFNTLDGRTVAVDAESGEELWVTQVADINHGESLTMAPLVVKDRVFVGNSGGEFGVRGWLTALETKSGRIAWRAYSTGPDKEVLIGAMFKPFYESDRGKDLGVKTWPKDAWKTGGGTVWGWMSYDPELDLLYYGTANPGPWNPDMRPGDNKWTAGIFARRPENGEAVWFYQWSPHDLYDHDGVNEQVLLELPVEGKPRKVLLRPERNGYMYLLDRATGQVLSADPFVHITTSKGVDLETGRLIPVHEKEPHTGKLVRDICPAAPGAKDWQPSAWSPRTGLLYVPHQNLCQEELGAEVNYIEGTPYVGANVRMYAGPGGHRGELSAWDPIRRRKAFSIRERFPVWSGALATAGDVVFYGTMEGWFKAIHARTGQPLWQFKTASGIIGQPITWRGPDGKQYVTVASGVGGWAGAIVAGELDPRDGTGALGFVNAMTDLPSVTERGGVIYTFGL